MDRIDEGRALCLNEVTEANLAPFNSVSPEDRRRQARWSGDCRQRSAETADAIQGKMRFR